MDPITEFLQEQTILTEMHFVKAYKTIMRLPVMTKDEFLEKIEPGDIILVQPKNYIDILKTTRKYLMQLAQRSLATSSKVYYGDKKVIGYDVVAGSVKNAVGVNSFDAFFDMYYRLIMVKPKHFEEAQRKKFLAFLKRRVGLDYNTDQLLDSLWNRTLGKAGGDKDMKEEDLKDLKKSFFCSNLISVGLYYAGWRGDFNGASLVDVWPVDFLLSEDFEKVGQLKNG